jgi:hypothetical protein
LAATVAVGSGCGEPPAPRDPAAEAALVLFELARGGEPEEERLARALGSPPPHARAALLDALATLAAQPVPHVVDVERPAGSDHAFVELESRLEGGGAARFTVRVFRSESGAWLADWFQGPGVEWPVRAAHDEGLSSSAPP